MKRAITCIASVVCAALVWAQMNVNMGSLSMSIKQASVVALPGTLTLGNAANRIHATGTLQMNNPSPSAISTLPGNGIRCENSSLEGGLRWNIKQAAAYTFPFINANGEAVPFGVTPATADANDRFMRTSTYGTAPDNTPYPPTVTNVHHLGGADHSRGMPDRFWHVTISSLAEVAMRFAYGASEAPPNGTSDMLVQYWISSGWQNGLTDQTQTGVREVQLNSLEFAQPGLTFSLQRHPVALTIKAMLDGPYQTGTNTMSDGLRASSLIPPIEPYTGLGHTMAGGSGLATIGAVLNSTGNDAPVDWVVVELRDAANSSQVVATMPGLLQRDGDVVGRLMTATTLMSMPPANYYVALRHRNHLGVMTAAPVAVGTTTPLIDFRAGGTATYGTDARKNNNGVMTLWSGDVVPDGVIKYTGSGNDRDPILTRIGGSTPNSTASGYYAEDVNMDGVVKYTGSANDRDPILTTIGATVPTSTRNAQLP